MKEQRSDIRDAEPTQSSAVAGSFPAPGLGDGWVRAHCTRKGDDRALAVTGAAQRPRDQRGRCQGWRTLPDADREACGPLPPYSAQPAPRSRGRGRPREPGPGSQGGQGRGRIRSRDHAGCGTEADKAEGMSGSRGAAASS